ncbi:MULTISPECIES: hypothetical protein [Bradyrhizobium]|uniref:Uncharacterized protein n=1 Tax=Bradyrhizobium barranii subsp. barranii TaxID=2823807 RepID=A0A7Z0TXA2_9BRAD|nr:MULTISPECIES: hypothetical protein [Bradyrhizobium]AHY50550.1 hypothetical protein BJS_03398 [Bradyrhizobium japonicum SEMIA 5079]MCD9109927.1 hypothetical protein [Bradyrhizobium japonicum]MCD9256667.1 hypothetical protein [Bradyrhizobium japonicum SEMIA 5079]MCD9910389.1 hypothetical protein [Bradyrhizobium japonicum]MCS3895576.1 vacuolar-type H+-ATPase subunit D/Vma8 [Bradyrhizobium japonicum USDA 38]
MAALKKKDTEEFRVPSLAESSQEYNGLIVKRQGLHERYLALNAESNKLRGEIEKAKAAGGQSLSPSVAALLGDAPDSLTLLSQRQREVATEMNNIEAAQEILRRRIEEARNGASKAVCDTVRQEYQRRLGDVCNAARALENAREQHDEFLDDVEREDVRIDYLRPVRPFFLGDRRQGKVFYYLKEVAEAGHNV